MAKCNAKAAVKALQGTIGKLAGMGMASIGSLDVIPIDKLYQPMDEVLQALTSAVHDHGNDDDKDYSADEDDGHVHVLRKDVVMKAVEKITQRGMDALPGFLEARTICHVNQKMLNCFENYHYPVCFFTSFQ